MKKLLIIALTLLIVFGTVSCSNNTQDIYDINNALVIKEHHSTLINHII